VAKPPHEPGAEGSFGQGSPERRIHCTFVWDFGQVLNREAAPIVALMFFAPDEWKQDSDCGESSLEDGTQTTVPTSRRTDSDNSNPDPASVTDASDGLTPRLTRRRASKTLSAYK